MIKKIIVGLFVLVVIAASLIVGYVFWIKVDRPTAPVEPVSLFHEKEYEGVMAPAERWLKRVYQDNLIPSISVSVGVQGDLVWEGSMGYADLEKETLAGHNTQYRVGSLSKSMTATAALRMQEKELLNIHSVFGKYVTDYPSENAGFTLKQLMAHQGGVRHYINPLSEIYSSREYSSTREAASIVEDDALLFPPGEGFNYSTYGYTLLSLAMENAYSMDFEDVMHREVFVPAEMTSTEFDKSGEPAGESVAMPYVHFGESLYKSPDVNLSNRYAGAGYLSTPSDLIRFSNALLNDTLLTPYSKNILWEPVSLKNGDTNPQGYALGFRVGRDELGRYVHHGGSSAGGYSFLLIYPEKKVVVAFASNVTPSGNSIGRLDEARKIARLFITQNMTLSTSQ